MNNIKENTNKEKEKNKTFKNDELDNSSLNKYKEVEKKEELVNSNKTNNRVFFIAIITAVLIFIIYVFVSQFLVFKDANHSNSRITLTKQENTYNILNNTKS